MTAIALILAAGLGFFLGTLTNGININIRHKEPEKTAPVPQEEQQFNSSTSDLLPEEVQLYYQKNNGFMK